MRSYRPLAVSDLFAGMTPAEFERWCGRWIRMTFPAGKIVYKPFQRGQVLFLVQRGRVALYQLRRGEKQILRTLGAGAIFGRMPLVGQLLPACFVETAAETALLILSRAAVEQLLRERPQVALRVMAQIGPGLVARELGA